MILLKKIKVDFLIFRFSVDIFYFRLLIVLTVFVIQMFLIRLLILVYQLIPNELSLLINLIFITQFNVHEFPTKLIAYFPI